MFNVFNAAKFSLVTQHILNDTSNATERVFAINSKLLKILK